MARFICNFVGLFLIFAGLLGFLAPGLMDLHLNQTHNLINLVTGVLALGFGSVASAPVLRKFALTFGMVFTFMGVAGYYAPPGASSMPGMSVSDHLLRLVPGELEFGTPDSLLHNGVGVFFLLAAMMPAKVPAEKKRRKKPVREKVVA